MKLLHKLILWALTGVALLLTFALPLYLLVDKLFIGQGIKAIINFGFAFALLFVLIIWMLWLRRIYFRKLDAIATVEEMGAKTATNFVVVRILKTIEYVIPFAFLALFMKGLTYVQIPPQQVFTDILWAMLGGFIVFLFHDFLKNYFIDQKEIADALTLDMKKEKLKQKQEIKFSKK